jgi:hypothetical protein
MNEKPHPAVGPGAAIFRRSVMVVVVVVVTEVSAPRAATLSIAQGADSI